MAGELRRISPAAFDPLVETQQLLCADCKITKSPRSEFSDLSFSHLRSGLVLTKLFRVMRCAIVLTMLSNFCFWPPPVWLYCRERQKSHTLSASSASSDRSSTKEFRRALKNNDSFPVNGWSRNETSPKSRHDVVHASAVQAE